MINSLWSWGCTWCWTVTVTVSNGGHKVYRSVCRFPWSWTACLQSQQHSEDSDGSSLDGSLPANWWLFWMDLDQAAGLQCGTDPGCGWIWDVGACSMGLGAVSLKPAQCRTFISKDELSSSATSCKNTTKPLSEIHGIYLFIHNSLWLERTASHFN